MSVVGRVSRGLRFNLFGKVAGSLLMVLNSIVLVRGLQPYGYGIFSLILSLLSFLTPFYGLGPEPILNRFT